MSVTLDVTESAIFGALGGLLASMLPTGLEVIRAQDNRVPEPGAANFVVMTPILRKRLETNTDTFVGTDDPIPALGITSSLQPTQLDVQIDVHGPLSADNVQIISTLWRDEYSTSYFDRGTVPMQALYASDPRQVAFIDAEDQYETRWIIDLSMQINATVTLPQDFADALYVGIINVDATYPG